ncbi:MAG TPA: PEP-CTERM sorting domain-containing protein [Deltaproteobacteria bacterium]|nr:PEP-CTERM sorting domain-containing protein [Deltaproteobacteria bacterium]
MKNSRVIIVIFLACLVGLPVSVSALPISGQGVYGSFSGEIYYIPENSDVAYMKLSLMNTSSERQYVYLAGLTFSNPSILGAWTEGTGALTEDGSNGEVQVYFGQEKEIWLSIVLKGEKLDTIREEQLLSNFNVLFSNGEGKIVDKVSVSVSEPSALLLLGIGLLGLGIAGRRNI